ncbi:DEAD/DEAH box helicase family protein [Babesia bovis T2Bo]|uniref:RNA helicase n=1 Tax=Babesia bovis TaxID=5865 RepID=A7ATM2_BABBO|nr:DEAD/DEAH box helicase family protein [Babesia bovis T2Bo]EDO06283.1 DEAD/DEAH box helicase family protein [Babesia bovis T2Bo]|eukprot:XP_001609851.1 DEAD box RNA helicase [Babesia bovis T2Bo]
MMFTDNKKRGIAVTSRSAENVVGTRQKESLAAMGKHTDLKTTNDAVKVAYVPKHLREQRLQEEIKKAEELAKTREEQIRNQRKELMRQLESNKRDGHRMDRKKRSLENTTENNTKAAVFELENSDLAKKKLLTLPNSEVRPRMVEKELEQIREHYLGNKPTKQKVRKLTEKFRNVFHFEWDNSDDTSRNDNNPIYQNRPEPQLLFGRGCRAGMDPKEQRKHADFYDKLSKLRTGSDAAFSRDSRSNEDRTEPTSVDDDVDTHWSAKTKENMTQRDWRIFREDFDIYVKGTRVPPPMRTWAESNLPSELLRAIKDAGFKSPTPIQMQAIPIGLGMRDLIGLAETGSGKTVAFVLPMLTYVKALPPLNEDTLQDGPYALTLAPTRELATQIHAETVKFSAFCSCRTVLVVGGHSVDQQGFELRNGAEIVIGTPGRIKDCLDRSYTVLTQCNYVILDEADRMIDMGFEEIVNDILDCIPTSNLKDLDENLALQQELSTKAGYRKYRITQMFSATMPAAVEKLTKKYLRSPVIVSIGDVGSGKKSITQRFEFITEHRKKQKLQDLLHTLEGQIIVFVNMKKVADVVARHISNMNLRAISLHGGKTQDIREGALESFKAGDFDILVATDVVGRGLDVKGVTAVINFDMPKDIETYTHRIGRTGRAGAKGMAISFVTEDDSHLFYDLKQQLISTGNDIPPELEKHPATNTKPATATKKQD